MGVESYIFSSLKMVTCRITRIHYYPFKNYEFLMAERISLKEVQYIHF